MSDKETDSICEAHPDIIAVEGGAKGLRYFFDSRRKEIVIAGLKGKVLLNKEQAIAIAGEIKDVIETWLEEV